MQNGLKWDCIRKYIQQQMSKFNNKLIKYKITNASTEKHRPQKEMLFSVLFRFFRWHLPCSTKNILAQILTEHPNSVNVCYRNRRI